MWPKTPARFTEIPIRAANAVWLSAESIQGLDWLLLGNPSGLTLQRLRELDLD